MKIQNYTVPRLEIEDKLERLTTGSLDRYTAIVVGPQYELSRYGSEVVQGFTFTGDTQTIPFTVDDGSGGFSPLSSSHDVDLGAVRLYGEDLEVELYQTEEAQSASEGVPEFTIDSLNTPNILKMGSSGTNLYFKGSDLPDGFSGRAAQLGDVVVVDDGSNTFRRKITGFVGVTMPSTYGRGVNAEDSLMGASAYNPDVTVAEESVVTPAGYTASVDASAVDFNTKGPTIAGSFGDIFYITCTLPGVAGVAEFKVTSKSGLYTSDGSIQSTDAGAGVFELSGDPSLSGVVVTMEAPSLTFAANKVVTATILADYTPLSLDSANPNLQVSGTYSGAESRSYILRVTQGSFGGASGSEFDGAVVTITDSLGLEPILTETITTDTPFDVGNTGLIFKFDNTMVPDQGGLKAGDVYHVNVRAATVSKDNFDKIILSGPAVDTSVNSDASQKLTVGFRAVYTGEIDTAGAASTSWSASNQGINIPTGLSLRVTTRDSEWVPFVSGVGYLFASFRALVVPGEDEGTITLSNTADISRELGVNDPDNPASYGAHITLAASFTASTGKAMRFIRVGEDTAEAYSKALAKLDSRDDFYSIAVLSERDDVHEVLTTHVEQASTSTKMNWRKGYVGVSSPGEYVVLSNTPVTISEIDGANVRMSFAADDFDLADYALTRGDIIEVPTLGAQYLVDSVISDIELILQSGPATPINPAIPVSIKKADTPANVVEFLNARSAARNSRRLVQCWGDRLLYSSDKGTIKVSPMYGACEIAGLRAALPPHQGLTRMEMEFTTSAPSMYLKFSEEHLNAIAEGGTLIFTQAVEGGAVFIRHQLTTDTSNGALYYEDSVTSNVDSILYEMKDVMGKYIGKTNVTTRTLLRAENDMVGILNERLLSDDTDLGSQLTSWRDLTLVVDSQLSDRARLRVKLSVPLPFNNLSIEVVVDQEIFLNETV